MRKLATVFILLLLTVSAQAEQYVWPVPYGTLTSSRGWRLDPVTKKGQKWHNGYDIAVPTGTPINPVASGVVTHRGWYGGYGWLVAVKHHSDGIYSLYGHNSKLLVQVGDQVDQTTVIALSGSSGRSTGPHLHLEYRWDTTIPEHQ